MAKKTPSGTPVFENWSSLAERVIKDPGFGYDRNPHRVLLWSEATGTGKSTFPVRALSHRNPVRVTLFRDMEPEWLIGPTQLVNGSTVDKPQLAALAMKEGRPLIIDEVDQFSASVETYLNAILDDKEIAMMILPNGTEVRPSDGYCVVATTNARPDSIPERILYRFDSVIHCDAPSQELLDSITPAYASLLAVQKEEMFFARVITRSVIALEKFEKAGFTREEAIAAVFGRDGQSVEALSASISANVARGDKNDG